MRAFAVRYLCASLVASSLFLSGTGRALAATFTVDTVADDFFGSCVAPGDCSLRSAIVLANGVPGPDTIIVPAGVYKLDPPWGAVEAIPAEAPYTGDLDVTDDVTITGAGVAATIVDGNGLDRVFEIGAAATVAISGMTIQNGNAAGDRSNPPVLGGGGILNRGSLTLSECVVRDNAAASGGGGIDNRGALVVVRSTIRNNAVTGRFPLFLYGGGGISSTGTSLTVTDSLVAGNSVSTSCGGINAYVGGPPLPGTVTLTNVTIDANRAEGIAGGACVNSTLATLTNVTITGNNSGDNIGGLSTGGALTLANSILADNVSATSGAWDCAGPVTSAGYNLIGNPVVCTITGDLTGNVTGVSPALGPLQENGGPTQSRAPLLASPAIDAGNPAAPGGGGSACAAADQRGVARPLGAACDMGAVESDCGDGVQQSFEACDDGNVVDGDGCDSNCTPTGCGNGIATGSEECDDGTGNGNDGCCSASCTVIDGDGDGTCDRDDPCTGGPVTAARLILGNLATPPGDDTILFKGSVTLPLPLAPPFHPERRGVRVLIEGATGTLVDAIVPAGFDFGVPTGWTVGGFTFVPGPPPNFVAHRWNYRDRSKPPALPGGVTKVKIRRAGTSGLVDFMVKGKGGGFAVSAADLPLKASLVFDWPTAETGQCAETRFAAAGCTLMSNGNRVTCK